MHLSVGMPSTTLTKSIFILDYLGISTQPTVSGLMKDHFTDYTGEQVSTLLFLLILYF